MRTNTIALASMLLPATALAQHTDVFLELNGAGDALITGAYDFDNPQDPITPHVRVFSNAFGEAGQPDFTDDPGFNALAGALPTDTFLGFDIIDALRAWDGQDFDAIPAESITIEKFNQFRTTPASAGGFTAGFFIATTGDTGGFHEHMKYFLDPPGSATPGVYLLTLQLRTNPPTIADPDPIYIVFDFQNPGGQQAVDDAVAYVESLLAPDPGCAGDTDDDGDTDIFDFNAVVSGFGTPAGATRADGDLTGDGAVDVFDFNTITADFGCAP